MLNSHLGLPCSGEAYEARQFTHHQGAACCSMKSGARRGVRKVCSAAKPSAPRLRAFMSAMSALKATRLLRAYWNLPAMTLTLHAA